jgi:pilus assembly protein FimV
MSRNLTRVWPLLVLAFASEAWALGLGDIRLSSALNEPLRAEVDLLSATTEELDNLTIILASSETFARYGLDRPLFLQGINFRIVKSGGMDGNVITVVSQDPITEPFITFLVEATWSRGRLLREYTLLLDPPTFAPPPVQESATAVTAPRQSTQADSGRIERQTESQIAPPPSREAQPTPAPSRGTPPPDPASFDTTSGGDYRVQRGDTLWGITQRMRPDSRLTMNQTMLAIFEANPQAFAGNINIMAAGADLRIPSADEIFRINRRDALSEVQRQNNEWTGVTPSVDTSRPSLTLVPPDDDQTGYDEGASTAAGDDADVDQDATETRIRDIEETLAAHQDSLIEIQDDELAALRQELARLRGEEYVEPDVIDDGADTTIDTTLEPDIIDDDLVADDTDIDDVGMDDTGAADVADTTAPPPVVVARPRDEPGIVDRVIKFFTEGIWGYLIGALVVVLGILVWFARRAARSDDEESTGVWDALDADDLDGESLASTERLRALAREDDTAIVVVEQETAHREPRETIGVETIEVPARSHAPVAAPGVEEDLQETTGESVALDDTFSSETAINLDQSDPVAEADFHMAYGLYDQAADLINGALAVEPEREDLLAKLCEIYFVWGNRDAFIDAALRMRTVIGAESRPDWDKIVIMGQQIAADHEMFSGAGPAPTREVDLSFEGALDEESDLDMDFATAGTGESEVIDLGGESGSGDGADDGLDMLFEAEPEVADDLEDMRAATANVPAAEQTGLTAEMPTAESDLSDLSGEIPAIDATGESLVLETTGELAAIEDTGLTAEMPTSHGRRDAGDATGKTPTIEEQFRILEETGELPSLSDDEVTRLASLDDEDEHSPDATGEIEIDDLGLDLDDLARTGLASDLEDTAERAVFPDDDLVATGTNEAMDDDDLAATGKNLTSDTYSGTGIHSALDIEATGRNLAFDDSDDTGIGVAIDASLLDATGQTQVLTGDMGVETASEIEDVISDQDKTLLASMDDDSDGLPEDAATLLAPLDDEETRDNASLVLATMAEDFDFAKTEALPKDVFTGIDPIEDTGELPGFAGTDMDLDLDDLTAALRVSEVGDTVDQPREDVTIEYPRPSGNDVDLDDEDLDPTTRLGPEDVTSDLHDARTMTEVGTKLDLARAYVDMGDPGGARSILEEVLDEGDDGQRQQAQQLLDSLPG